MLPVSNRQRQCTSRRLRRQVIRGRWRIRGYETVSINAQDAASMAKASMRQTRAFFKTGWLRSSIGSLYPDIPSGADEACRFLPPAQASS